MAEREGTRAAGGGALEHGPLRVVVVDTDSGFLRVLTGRLEAAGIEHRVTASPVPLDTLTAMRLNALVVDPAAIGEPAWAYLEALCGGLPQLAIVVCTGASSVAQRVRALRLGVDDWMTKPCHPEEVVARVEAVVRRRRLTPATDTGTVVVGELEIRAGELQAFVRGSSARLTRREFQVLQLLATAERMVLSRDEIYQRVWGYAMAHGDRSVDAFVRKLRQKLMRVSPGWRYVHTHVGVGYRLAAEPVDPSVGRVRARDVHAPLLSNSFGLTRRNKRS